MELGESVRAIPTPLLWTGVGTWSSVSEPAIARLATVFRAKSLPLILLAALLAGVREPDSLPLVRFSSSACPSGSAELKLSLKAGKGSEDDVFDMADYETPEVCCAVPGPARSRVLV